MNHLKQQQSENGRKIYKQQAFNIQNQYIKQYFEQKHASFKENCS